MIYTFSLAVFAQAQSNSQEVHNASVAYLDQDHSVLSRRMIAALLPPYFKKPQPIGGGATSIMRWTRPLYLRDRHSAAFRTRRSRPAGSWAATQVNVDATAMVQAGLGSGYMQQILTTEVAEFRLPQ